jgi:K+-sensing histidine kinase KdpD
MKKQTALFFYVLGFYVILQFTWWGYHLVDLTTEIEPEEKNLAKKIFMIFSEGMVFFIILMIGLWKIRSSIRKELSLSQRQNNFLLSVTHELKTPLAANKLYLQTILKRDLETDKRNSLIQKAIGENQRLEAMIDNILNASRLENQVFKVHLEKIDFSQLLTDIKERYNKILQKEVLIIEIEGNFSINADRFMLEAIINNLIDNSIKYAGIDSPITIYSRKSSSGNLIFGVKDCGNGIPSDFQSEIFNKFVRIGNEDTRAQKGTGLGLFIVAEFVRMQGGKIKYIDNKPSGANFEITF